MRTDALRWVYFERHVQGKWKTSRNRGNDINNAPDENAEN
jgi:hypothetical protein